MNQSTPKQDVLVAKLSLEPLFISFLTQIGGLEAAIAAFTDEDGRLRKGANAELFKAMTAELERLGVLGGELETVLKQLGKCT